MKPCPRCAEQIQDAAVVCRFCGHDFQGVERKTPKAPSRGQWVGMTGAVLLAMGAFAPLVSAPMLGTINYVRNGNGDGVVILVIAAIALAVCA